MEGMGLVFIPFGVMVILCWYARICLIIKGDPDDVTFFSYEEDGRKVEVGQLAEADKKIPRGIIILGLVLGLLPIINIIAIVIGIMCLCVSSKIGFTNTKINKFLNG